MQACRAYYNDGRFVPLGLGKLPEGTPAIITLLDETPHGVSELLKDFDNLAEEIRAAAGEAMPPIEQLNFHRSVEQ
jgi:hypothetical protein